VTEISGIGESDVSGNRPSLEWISSPTNKSVLYEIDARGSANRLESIENNSNLSESDFTVNTTFVLDLHDKDAELNETTGKIDNSTTISKRISVNMNNTTALGASGRVDFEPDTYNKQSGGNWVNVAIEIPHDEIDVGEVNLSSIRLNEKVAPVTDSQYGFVRNPVKNDTLTVKFPREDVSEMIDTGENITIFITAETDDQELLTGIDKVRVIERPGNGIPPQCPPKVVRELPSGGSGQGPPNGTSGQGPPDELPGHGPPECLENDEEGGESNDSGDINNSEPSGRDVDQRRDAGRGQERPEEDRNAMSRGDVQSETDRRTERQERSRGR